MLRLLWLGKGEGVLSMIGHVRRTNRPSHSRASGSSGRKKSTKPLRREKLEKLRGSKGTQGGREEKRNVHKNRGNEELLGKTADSIRRVADARPKRETKPDRKRKQKVNETALHDQVRRDGGASVSDIREKRRGVPNLKGRKGRNSSSKGRKGTASMGKCSSLDDTLGGKRHFYTVVRWPKRQRLKTKRCRRHDEPIRSRGEHTRDGKHLQSSWPKDKHRLERKGRWGFSQSGGRWEPESTGEGDNKMLFNKDEQTP